MTKAGFSLFRLGIWLNDTWLRNRMSCDDHFEGGRKGRWERHTRWQFFMEYQTRPNFMIEKQKCGAH